MTPLTIDCARARQLLPAYHDRALDEPERAWVDGHLDGCPACREQLGSLERALAALSALSADDLARLRAELPPEGGLDTRPLSRLVVVSLVAALLLLVGLTLLERRPPPAPSASPEAVAASPAARPAFPLPEVGAEVGLEEDPELAAELAVVETAPPAAPPLPEPPSPAPPLEEAREPAPVAAAPAAPEAPVDAAADRAPPAQPAPKAAAVVPPEPPPAQVAALLGRLQLSSGLAYRDLTFYFVRDPEGRDRLGRARAPEPLPAREASPPDPERCAVKPERGARAPLLLAGELLDAPFGLRLAPRDVALSGSTQVDVVPVAWDGLEGRGPTPILKAQVLAPSGARRAVVKGEQAAAVVVLLEALDDPSLLELRRLRAELGDLEPEARDLERRLRALVGGTRGLRGVAISVRGGARTLDLFDDARGLSEALPRLLRGALLEASLEEDTPDEDTFGDPRSQGIRQGDDGTRAAHAELLALLGEVARPGDADDALSYRAEDRRGVSLLVLTPDARVLHGAAFRH